MRLIKRSFQILVFTFFVLPISAFASSWSCSHDNDVREIHVMSTDPAGVPCEVVYKKLTEGVEDQVLWSANNDSSYCETKAKDFVAKQEGWGWVCAETISEETGNP